MPEHTVQKDNVTSHRPHTGQSTAKDGADPKKTVTGKNYGGKDNAKSTQRNLQTPR